jgi:hypothetical protein
MSGSLISKAVSTHGVAAAPRGCALVAIAGLALAGCGGSGHKGVTAAQVSTPSSLGAPNTIAGEHATQFAGKTGQMRFQSLANTICQTVRTGSPAPLRAPVQAEDLRKYALAAARADTRTTISLKRLGAPSSVRSRLERLIGDLQHLQQTYAQAQSGKASSAAVSSMVQSLTVAEGQAGNDALASGLPACAPHPPGISAMASPLAKAKTPKTKK